jgi:hypothetical protein
MMATADTGIEDTPRLRQQHQPSHPDSWATNDGGGTIFTTTNKKRTTSPSSSEFVSSKVQKSTGGGAVVKNEEEANELDEDYDSSAILDKVSCIFQLFS